MTIDHKINNGKLLQDINIAAAKISVLSFRKVDKYEYLASEEMLPFDENRVIEQAKFNYSPLGKALEKQRKTIKDQRIKQVEALKSEEEQESVEEIFPKNTRTDEIKNEIYEIKNWEEKMKQKDLNYEAGKYKYDFQQYERIRCSGERYAGKINIREAEMNQTNLLENMTRFNNKSRPKAKENKAKK